MSKKWKRILLLLLSNVLVLATTAAAVPEAESVIDYNQTGSLTLQKFTENSEISAELAEQDLAEYLQQNPGALTPLADVTFRYVKIGEIQQYTNDGTVSIGYAVDSVTEAYLNLNAEDIAATADGRNIYDVKVLDEKLNLKTATETERYMDSQNAIAMPKTNSEGKTTVDNLHLGLYLIAEYSYPSTAIADEDHCAPFLVSLPSSDGANGNWSYDLTISPKNILAPIHNDKKIVRNNGNETTEVDAEIGKPVTFIIRSDIPYAIGKLETYRLVDTLSSGLTFDQDSYRVYAVSEFGARVQLDNDDFSFSAANNILTWDFNCSALADADGWSAFDSIEIYYTAKLNKNAIIGGNGNPNEVRTEYSRFTNVKDSPLESIAPPPVRVFTYALNILKVASGTKEPLTGACFILKDEDGKKLETEKQADGNYYLHPGGSSSMCTDDSGNLRITGLQAGTYYLKEIESPKGFMVLRDEIKIEITSNEFYYSRSDSGSIFRTESSTRYVTDVFPRQNFFSPPLDLTGTSTVSAGTYVSAGTNSIQKEDGGRVELFDADPLTWDANYTMGTDRDSTESGVVKIEVENQSNMNPQTGDKMQAIIGWSICVIVAITGLVIVLWLDSRGSKKDQGW